MTDEKQYNVGAEVWYAHYNMVAVKKPCPVCFGRKEVTLILGDNNSMVLPCGYCGHGLDEPRGYTTEYEYVARAEHAIITKVESVTDGLGEQRRYYFGGRYAAIEDLFDTEVAAVARCVVKIAVREREENTRPDRIKAHQAQSYAWNAGYHIRQAAQHRKQAEYHDRKAVLCKARAK